MITLAAPLDVLLALTLGLLTSALGLAILAIARRVLSQRRLARSNALRALWGREIWNAVFGDSGPDPLLALVPPRSRREFVTFALPLTRRVRGEELERLGRVFTPLLPSIRAEADRRSMARRAVAIEALGAFGGPADIERVAQALLDPSPLVSMIAVRVLVVRPDAPRFAEAVLDALGRFRLWERRFVSSLLAQMGAGAAPALRARLADEATDPWEAAVAAEALMRLGDPSSGPVAAGVLDATVDDELRAACLRLLAQVGSDVYLRSATHCLGSPSMAVRAAAVDAFARLGGDPRRLRDLIVDDPSPWVAIHAGRGLRDLGHTGMLLELSSQRHPRSVVGAQVLAEVG